MYMCKISCRIYVFRGADALVCKNCITRVCVRESLGWRAPIALFQIVNGLKYEICCVVIWIVVFLSVFGFLYGRMVVCEMGIWICCLGNWVLVMVNEFS